MYRQSTRKRKLTKEQKIKMFYQFNSFHQNTKPQKLKVISSLNLRLITPLLTPSNHSDFFFLILTGEYKNTSQFQIIMIHDSVVEVVVHDLTVLQLGFLISATEEVDVVFIVTAIYVTTANQLFNIFK